MILVTALTSFVVGLSKGGLPSVGTLGVPLMALAMSPVIGAALLLPIYLATDLAGLWLYRRSYSARKLGSGSNSVQDPYAAAMTRALSMSRLARPYI